MESRIETSLLHVKSMKPHYHKDLLEIILVLNGTVDVYKVERKITLNRGEFTFVNRNVVHYLISEGADIISCKIRLSEFKYIYDKIEYVEFMASNELNDVEKPLMAKLNVILIDNIIRLLYLRNQHYLVDDVLFNENEIMYSLFREYQLISYAKKETGDSNEDIQDRYYFVVEYIMNNMNKKILTQDIVSKLYMNPTYFSQFMKKVGGTGFKEFVLYRKLIFILTYLIENQYSMNEIASFVGITDMKSFYNIFKKSFHMSPTKWKNKVNHIEDNYNSHVEKEVLDQFVLDFNIHKHKDNTISKLYKELQILKDKGYSLKGAKVIVNPYADMGKTIDPDYQVYKCMDSLIKIIRELNGVFILKYPYYYLKDQKQHELLIKTITWVNKKNLLKSDKESSIVLDIESFEELEDILKIKKEIKNLCSYIDVEISIENVEVV